MEGEHNPYFIRCCVVGEELFRGLQCSEHTASILIPFGTAVEQPAPNPCSGRMPCLEVGEIILETPVRVGLRRSARSPQRRPPLDHRVGPKFRPMMELGEDVTSSHEVHFVPESPQLSSWAACCRSASSVESFQSSQLRTSTFSIKSSEFTTASTDLLHGDVSSPGVV